MNIILVAIITASSSLLGVVVANLYQLKKQKMEEKHKEKIENQKAEREEKAFVRNVMREKLEEAHQIISKINFENSQTISYITNQTLTIGEFHQRYQNNKVELDRLRMIIGIYFSNLTKYPNILDGNSNLFWGNQMSYMETGTHNTSAMSKILSSAESIEEDAKVLHYELESVASKLKLYI